MNVAAYARELAAPQRRLLEGAGWSVAGAACAQLCLLGAAVGVARLLGPARFGAFAFIQTTVNMAANVSAAGLGLTAMSQVPHLRRADPARAAAILLLSRRASWVAGLVCASALWFSAGPLARRASAEVNVDSAVRSGGVLLCATILQTTSTGALLGLEQFSTAAQLNALRGVLMAAFSLAGAALGGESGAIAGLVASSILLWALTEHSVRRACARAALPLRSANALSALGSLWNFSLPAFFSSLLCMPVQWGAQALLLVTPGGLEQTALLQAAVTFRNAVLFLPTQIGQAAIPVLAGTGQSSARRTSLRWCWTLTALAALPAGLLLAGFRAPLMGWFGPVFRSNSHLLLWTAATGVLIALALPAGHLLAATGRMWTSFALNLIWAVLLLSLSAWGLHQGGGATAVVQAFLVSYAIHLLLSLLATRRFA
jgi:O-antigen/teichoic acid export membrane protein